MIQNQTFNILWDMDGVLYKFFADAGNKIFKPGYFRDLPLQENIADAALNGMRIGNIKLESWICSSYLANNETALAEKNDALNRDFKNMFSPQKRIFLPCGYRKTTAVSSKNLQGNILIDDYGKNLSDWNGPCIKVSRDATNMTSM